MKTNKTEEVDNILEGLEGDFRIGKAYHVRTVTDHWVGRVTKVTDKYVYLEQASWIAVTGRFSAFMAGKIEPEEVEPTTVTTRIKLDVIAAVLDWNNPLPTTAK